MSTSLCARVWRSRNRSMAQPPQNAQGRPKSAITLAMLRTSWNTAMIPLPARLYRPTGDGTRARPRRRRGGSGTMGHMSTELPGDLIRGLSKAASQPGVRAVLFDLDDTLFDHQASSRAGLLAVREVFPSLASEPFDAFEQRYRIILEEVHLLVLSGELSPADARSRRFGRFLSETFAPCADDVELAAAAYFAGFRASRRPVAGAVALLQHLRTHVKIGVVTNNVLAEQVEKLRHLEFAALVDVLVASEEVGVAKPHPKIFHAALERLACTPDQVVMVGDNWENDIVGASRVGIRSIWLNRYADPHPDVTLAPQITELAPLEDIARLLLDRP